MWSLGRLCPKARNCLKSDYISVNDFELCNSWHVLLLWAQWWRSTFKLCEDLEVAGIQTFIIQIRSDCCDRINVLEKNGLREFVWTKQKQFRMSGLKILGHRFDNFYFKLFKYDQNDYFSLVFPHFFWSIFSPSIIATLIFLNKQWQKEIVV